MGPWEVYFSEEEAAVYFKSSEGNPGVLRLLRDDLLVIAQEMENWRRTDGKVISGRSRKAGTKPPTTARNKRRFRRFTRRCETEFTSSDVTNRGIACDFSINGLFIRTNHPFPADTPIDITVHLPNTTISTLKGKVKRAMRTSFGRATGMQLIEHKNGMGVEITEKDATYLHFIRSLIK